MFTSLVAFFWISLFTQDVGANDVKDRPKPAPVRVADAPTAAEVVTNVQQFYKDIKQVTAKFRQQVMNALERTDILVSATMPYPPPKHTAVTASFTGAEDVRARFFFRRSYTGCYALTALPAISIPGGFTADNLPIGVQLAARPFAEATLLQAAYAYEQETPWHTRRAPAAEG